MGAAPPKSLKTLMCDTFLRSSEIYQSLVKITVYHPRENYGSKKEMAEK